MERFRPSLRAHDLTDQQWRVLRALFDHGQKDLSELAELCCLLKPSLTRIIRSMETRKLLIRQDDSNDQRRTIVSITSSGCDLIAQVGPFSEQVYQDIAVEFGQAKLDELYQNLDALMANLNKNKDE